MTFKERAEAIVKNFWNTFAQRKSDVVDQCLQFIHPDFVGYGTEPHEVWHSLEDFKKQLLNELEFAPDPVSISVKSMHTMISGSVAVCVADLLFRFKIGHKELEIDPFRLIATLQETDNGLKILSMASISFDFSVPDQVPWPGLMEPRKYDDVSILFCDIAGFSKSVASIPPKSLANELNDLFSAFDDLSKSHQLDKVKTIGDAYMAISGVRPEQSEHAKSAVEAGIAMINFLEQRNKISPYKWELRIGVHSGPVVAGIMGKQGLSFDVWGSTVNLAHQIEQKGKPGRVNISAYTFQLVKDTYDCTYRGKIQVKNNELVDMYLVNIESPEL